MLRPFRVQGHAYGGLRKTNSESNAHHLILDVGTNDIPTKKAPDKIAENIVNLSIKHKRN